MRLYMVQGAPEGKVKGSRWVWGKESEQEPEGLLGFLFATPGQLFCQLPYEVVGEHVV